MRIIKSLLLVLILWGLSGPLFAQDKIIKEYLDDGKLKKFCFYPSTLRMINFSNNEAFNEMVKGIEKLLFFNLDPDEVEELELPKMISEYRNQGFEEYVMMVGGSTDLQLFGTDEGTNQMVGYMREKDRAVAIYLRGEVEWQKIPTLMNQLNSIELLNLNSLINDSKKDTTNRRVD